MPRVVGIDLGTTNSLVAYIDDLGNPRVIRDPELGPLIRSVVAFTPEGIGAVGEAAIEESERDPSRVVYSVKRLMGVAPKDVGQDLARYPQKVSEDDRVVRLAIQGREYSAPEISSAILRVLKHAAEKHFGEPITQSVITVPAYFDDAQRQATKDAARLAGLEVLRLVNEPTAAALAYGLDSKREGKVAVFDLGGGTFDVSILNITNGVFEVLSTAGDTHLGGDDFDMRLAERFLARHGVELLDADKRFRARRAGERTMRALTEAERAPFALNLPDGQEIRGEVTREEFEHWTQDLIERTGARCRQALSDAKLRPEDLNEVVLVGGSTRMPLVRRYVASLFGREPRTDVDPDQVVALGAAIQANILSGGEQTLLLLDVTPLSLGIETMGGIVANLIPRNSTIPIAAQNVFTTHIDGQTAVEIHVLQGERDLARDCRSLARFKLSGIPPLAAGLPRIEVTFQLDADGILHVNAREERSGVEARVEVKPSYGLGDEEIEKMLLDSFDHAEGDVASRLLVEARLEAESILHVTEKALAEDGDILLSPAERQTVEGAIKALRAMQSQEDAEAIRASVSALDTATIEFAQRRMNRAIQQALGGRDLSQLGGTLELSIPIPPKK